MSAPPPKLTCKQGVETVIATVQDIHGFVDVFYDLTQLVYCIYEAFVFCMVVLGASDVLTNTSYSEEAFWWNKSFVMSFEVF